MDFNFLRNTMTVKAIYDAFRDDRLIIDNSYQRRKVWMLKDKVRLIETILLSLIIPEIFLWDFDTDPDTGATITHIVDGQQRINAIIDFIAGEYKLTKKYLLDEEIRDNYGDMEFKMLPQEVRKQIWSYNLSMVNIDKRCTKQDITNLFYRLNLTNYSLNEQEKRNSLDSEFGKVSEKLADKDFWGKHKVFSPADIRRMKDVEFCSNILILAREGIVDQTGSQKINQVYDDLKEEYLDKKADIDRIESAMDLIDRLTNDATDSFISKKSQIYSVFSFTLDLIDNETELTQDIINKFTAFVTTYNNFKNELELSFHDSDLSQIYESIKRYKLASSEGVNKISNRVIRFEVLKNNCINNDEKTVDKFNEINESLLNQQE